MFFGNILASRGISLVSSNSSSSSTSPTYTNKSSGSEPIYKLRNSKQLADETKLKKKKKLGGNYSNDYTFTDSIN